MSFLSATGQSQCQKFMQETWLMETLRPTRVAGRDVRLPSIDEFCEGKVPKLQTFEMEEAGQSLRESMSGRLA